MRLRIGLDIDGVLADFNEGFVKELNRISGLSLPYDVSRIDVWNYAEKYGFPKKAATEFWNTVGTKGQFWYELKPLCSQEELHDIAWLTANHDVYFITTRPFPARRGTRDWLSKHLGKHQGDVILSKDKGAIAKGLQLNVMVDDKPENLIDVTGVKGHLSCKAILLDQPWNHDFNVSAVKGARVYTVKEAQNYIEENVCVS